MTAPSSHSFTIAPGSVLRLPQILAPAGYLPVTFTQAPGTGQPATMAGGEAIICHPPPGRFFWR